jgi:hypothetical protein
MIWESLKMMLPTEKILLPLLKQVWRRYDC